MTQSRPASAPVGRRYTLGVFIGRFQPPTRAHQWVIEQGLTVADTLLICIGSANAARRVDYLPFTAPEREQMIRLLLTPEQNRRVRFAYIEDQGNMPKWTKLIRASANAIEPDNSKITLCGFPKDRSSGYLSAFRGWHPTNPGDFNGISATTYRNIFFSEHFGKDADPEWENAKSGWHSVIHPDVHNWLVDFRKTSHFDYLIGEAIDVAKTRKKYGGGTAATSDAVVIHGDHVLMIMRKNYPFRDHWAFPGGIVERDEPMKDAIFRELIEETRIKVPEQILRQNYIHEELLDHPFRDPRGRYISLAGLIYLNPKPPATMTDPNEIKRYLALPAVKPRDDAKKAEWVPIADVRRETTAFDHFMVLQTMLDYIPKGD